MKASRGFTIVEMLVVIFVLGVLLSIVLPALRGAREAGRLTAVVAHQRDVSLVLRKYAYDHGDQFPYYGVAGTWHAPLVLDGYPLPDFYWDQARHWGAYLTEMGYDTTASMISPPGYEPPIDEGNIKPPHAFGSLDLMTWTALAAPRYWGEPQDQHVRLHTPQRWSTVLHPSGKGVLRRFAGREPVWPYSGESPFSVTFADGHVGLHRGREFREAVGVIGAPQGAWVLTTRDGLLGRDL